MMTTQMKLSKALDDGLGVLEFLKFRGERFVDIDGKRIPVRALSRDVETLNEFFKTLVGSFFGSKVGNFSLSPADPSITGDDERIKNVLSVLMQLLGMFMGKIGGISLIDLLSNTVVLRRITEAFVDEDGNSRMYPLGMLRAILDGGIEPDLMPRSWAEMSPPQRKNAFILYLSFSNEQMKDFFMEFIDLVRFQMVDEPVEELVEF